MADDDVRRKILLRRATYLAAALTGLSAGAAGCDRDGGMGQPCLSIAQPPPDAEVEPRVCLKVAPSEDASKPEPRVCLKVAPPDPEEEPAPCLSVARPPPKGS
jgi:hypothetical protein